MITFTHFLTEIFDKPYAWKKNETESFEMPLTHKEFHAYTFNDGKHDYNVNFEHRPDDTLPPGEKPKHSVEVSFGRKRGKWDLHGVMSVTNDHSHPHRVFSTVKDILSHHVKTHGGKISHIHFVADANEPSRTKLYDKMVSKLGGDKIPSRGRGSFQFHTYTLDPGQLTAKI